MPKYYILVISGGGADASKTGPYDSEEERDAAAKEIWKTTANQEEESLFKMDAENSEVDVFPFSNVELE